MKKKQTIREEVMQRREFLQLSAGGIGFIVLGSGMLSACNKRKTGVQTPEFEDVSAFVKLAPGGEVLIYSPASEMGQGSMTSLAMIIAEEMDVDWDKVTVKHSPIEPKIYGLTWSGQLGGAMLTVGSRTVAGYYENLRVAGAQVRRYLMEAVSNAWEVPINELSTKSHLVTHEASKRKISYGEIISTMEFPLEIPDIPTSELKDPSRFRIIGNPGMRCDIPVKVDGTAIFSMDILLPDMVYAMISRSLKIGSKPASWNKDELESIIGFLGFVELEHGVGIYAENMEALLKAREVLKVEWDETNGSELSSEEVYGEYVALIDKGIKDKEMIIEEHGRIKKGFDTAVKTYEADYLNDFVYHCQMEPLNAVIAYSEESRSAEVWAGSQAPGMAKTTIANVLGIEEEQVKFNPCYLGGGFGRRSMSDFISEAAIMAKEIKQPVKLIWTKEDDLKYGAFRPQSLQRLKAGIGSDGKLISWSHLIVGQGSHLMGSGAKTEYYYFPHQKVSMLPVNHGIRVQYWRSVGHGPNKFAIEAFIDEIARDQHKDPLEFRLTLMADKPRAQKVLKTAAAMANWGSPIPEGRALGMAFAERSQSLGAAVCEISVDKNSGEIRVHKFWVAIDAGIVVHPDNAIAQLEGGILMGISSVLKERISFKKGIVQQSNYDDYQILRMNEIPDSIEIKLIDSNERPTGIGESSTPLVGGAIANAFLSLTGKALRHMPFTPSKVTRLLTSS